jgi:hypothetical protein
VPLPKPPISDNEYVPIVEDNEDHSSASTLPEIRTVDGHRDHIPTNSTDDTGEIKANRFINAPARPAKTSVISKKLESRGQTLWDAAKITSSPTLTTLMDAMWIDEKIPQLNISDPSESFPQSGTIVRMRDIINHPVMDRISQDNETTENTMFDELTGIVRSRSPTATPERRNPNAKFSGNFHYLDMFQKFMSPLNEISPSYFHKPIVTNVKLRSGIVNRPEKVLYREIRKSQQHLYRLHAAFPENNQGVMLAMHTLADLYSETYKAEYLEAGEKIYLKVLASSQKNLGPSHPRTVMAYLGLIMVKKRMNQFTEARKIHENVSRLKAAKSS